MTDAALKQAFNRDGYVVVPDVVSSASLESVMAECRAIFRRQTKRHGIAETDFDSALTALFTASMASYLGAARLTQYLPSLHRIGADGPLLDLVRRLGIENPVISTRPVVHIVSDSLVVPGGYHRTPSHQDWRSVQGSLDAVAAWLPLVPVEAGRNTLEVIPGSHRMGLLPAVPHPFGTEVEADRIDETAFVPVQGAPGDVVLFSMFLVHKTGAGRGAAARWAASFRYNNLDEPSFVDRDYPNPYIYKPRDDLLFDDFPTESDLRRVFGGN